MEDKFLEGETYRNTETNQHIMVLAVAEETEVGVLIAYLEVDPTDFSTTLPGEVEIPESEFDDWELVEI